MSAVACRARGGDPMGGGGEDVNPPQGPELFELIHWLLLDFEGMKKWVENGDVVYWCTGDCMNEFDELDIECFKEVNCCDLAKLCVLSLWFNWCLENTGRDFQLEVHHWHHPSGCHGGNPLLPSHGFLGEKWTGGSWAWDGITSARRVTGFNNKGGGDVVLTGKFSPEKWEVGRWCWYSLNGDGDLTICGNHRDLQGVSPVQHNY